MATGVRISLKRPESRHEEKEKRSLPGVNEHFLTTSNTESGLFRQALKLFMQILLILVQILVQSCAKPSSEDSPAPRNPESSSGSNTNTTVPAKAPETNTQGGGSGGGSEGHGGDIVELTFRKARELAATIVEQYQPIEGVTSADANNFFDNKMRTNLANDIRTSKHVFVDEALPHDAMTGLKEFFPIKLSRIILRGTILEDAAKLLLHESIHHMHIADETIVNNYTASAMEFYYHNQHLQPGSAHWKNLYAPTDLLAFGAKFTSVLMDNKMLTLGSVKTNRAGWILDPLNLQWKMINSEGQPSWDWTENVGAIWTGKEVLVVGGKTESGSEIYSYNPSLDKWQILGKKGPEMIDLYGFTPAHSPALLLSQGNLFLVGGFKEMIGAIFDPVNGFWDIMARSPIKNIFTRAFLREQYPVVSINKGQAIFVLNADFMRDERAPVAAIYNVTDKSWEVLPNNFSEVAGLVKVKDYISYLQSITWLERSNTIFALGCLNDKVFALNFSLSSKTWDKIEIGKNGPSHCGPFAAPKAFDYKENELLIISTSNLDQPIYKYDIKRKLWSSRPIANARLLQMPDSRQQVLWTGESFIVTGDFNDLPASEKPKIGVIIDL